ncbi:MAG: hypothetical protein QOF61_3149, partial [Acidobacteriota bacterium]|nr:hypothetical protein [Acidobacteriota bacterium]
MTTLAHRRLAPIISRLLSSMKRKHICALSVAAAALLALALQLVPPSGAQSERTISPRQSEQHRAPGASRGGADGAQTRANAPDPSTQAKVSSAYGQLPIGFVANAGQFDSDVKFSSRGGGYQLFLTPTEAVLELSSHATQNTRRAAPSAEQGVDSAPERRAVLRLKLQGAAREARVSGEGQLPGRINYLIGDDPAKWRTGLPAFARVRYAGVYRGVDLVYYGNQRQLEYDFIVAPRTDPRRIRLKFEGAREVTTDEEGQLLLRAADGYVTQRKPVVYQTVAGIRREVAGRYVVNARGEVSFAVGNYDRSQPLVIDPVLSYATYLGGSADDQANGVAVDANGNAYVVGQTSSTNFPTTAGALRSTKTDFGSDAFVAKLNPAGTALVYSTYLGGASSDIAYGVAVDAGGAAYVTGTTSSADFPHTNGAPQSAKSGGFDAFAAKLDASGSSLVYSTFIGGVNGETGYGVGVDAGGNAYVAGSAASPSINGTTLPKHGSPTYKSADAGGTWAASSNGIADAGITSLTVDPTNSSTLYAAGSVVLKSTDGGASWSATPPLLFSPNNVATPRSITVDPTAPATLYAATTLGLYKSTDGGNSWVESDNGFSGSAISNYYVLVDPSSPATLYAGTLRGIYKSTNGGSSWVAANNGLTFSPPTVYRLAFDPTNSGTIYAATARGVFKSTNGGNSWTPASTGLPGSPSLPIVSLAIDPASPNTLYAASQFAGVFKSTDGGGSWSAANNGLTATFNGTPSVLPTNAVAINPLAPATLYAATNLGVYKTTDGGATWAASNNGLANKIINGVVVDRLTPANVYAATSSGSEAFAAKINPGGTAFGYLAYLGGNESDYARGVAVDAAGNAYLAGVTNSSNFPTANAAQPASGGYTDAFVTKLDAGGSVVYSTYLGGGDFDEAAAVAIDASGRAYVTGDTFSNNFPTTETRKPQDTTFLDAFVARIGASGSTLDYSFLLGGGGMDQGFGIAADAGGNAYVTGTTSSTDFPATGSTQACSNSAGDAFVTKLSPASAVIYSTCIGGGGSEQGLAIAAAAGGAYVVGVTNSSNFPTTSSSLRPMLGGGTDAFAVRIG